VSELPTEIVPAELASLLRSEDPPILLDVRERWEHELVRIEGSILIPMGTLPRHVGELDRDRRVVTICHVGIRSLNSALFLRSEGFAKAQSLAGGIDLWARIVDPEMKRY
jgi:rhodanese-related sulfurtransferase